MTMPNVFANLLNRLGHLFQGDTKQKPGKSRTKLEAEDIQRPDEAVTFLRALADRIEAGDFGDITKTVPLNVDGTPIFECDIDLKEAIKPDKIQHDVKIKLAWEEHVKELSVHALTDSDLGRMDERYLGTLKKGDLLVVSQKLLKSFQTLWRTRQPQETPPSTAPTTTPTPQPTGETKPQT
jgi:hypothetical protein